MTRMILQSGAWQPVSTSRCAMPGHSLNGIARRSSRGASSFSHLQAANRCAGRSRTVALPGLHNPQLFIASCRITQTRYGRSTRRQHFDSAAPKGEGFLAFLPLTTKELKQLVGWNI